ncbi:hypothetical protein M231_06630 [Tremella mesenterica]|uniref:Uncharacterized protein n=1 Tax=Tremella mesenterica TaxID=5217 RepID=A0A4Q1BBJ8_TREME|nr:hypothetical protein M231_06630 [Tremella mesenterica]
MRIVGEELKEWEKWQARENKAQGMIKGTVSDAVMLDLSEKMSAKEMWDYCVNLHVTATIENQRNVRQALFSYDLRDNATAEEMAKHVDEFSKTMAEAKLVGLIFDSQERAGLFLNTILDRTWDKVLMIFNAETARHTACPVGRTNRKGFAMFAERDKGMRVNRDNISDGHLAKYCRKPKREDTNRKENTDGKDGGKKKWRINYKNNKKGHTVLKDEN